MTTVDAGPVRAGRVVNLLGDLWGGLAAMLVALPSAIAFGVVIYSPLGSRFAAEGALAGIIGTMVLGLVVPLSGGGSRLISAPCAPAAAVLAALAVDFAHTSMRPDTILVMLGLIALMAGLIQIVLGLSRVGQLIKYIPFPVVSGYMSGVGLIIIGGQIPKLLGVSGDGVVAALSHPALWSWQSLVVGGAAMIGMMLPPRVTGPVPSPIIALGLGVGAYQLLGLVDPALLVVDGNSLLVGSLAAGVADPAQGLARRWNAMRGLDVNRVLSLVVPAATLAALLSIDALKTCLVVDVMTRAAHDPNRELRGQGLGNMVTALAGGVPGSATMGPSLVSISGGGNSRLSGLVTGALSLVAFLYLAPLIAWVPVPALAAILMVVGYRMIDRNSLAFFFTRSTRFDFVVILVVILVALFGNLVAASGVGVALAILLFIHEQTRSSVVRSRMEGFEIFSKRSRTHQDMETLMAEGAGTVVFELQGSLFFGTASQLFAALEPETAEAAGRKFVILSMRRVQSLDVTATHVLEQIKDRLEERGAHLIFCDIPKGLPSGLKMKRFLKETGVMSPTDKASAFHTLDDALEWVEAQRLDCLPLDQDRARPLGLREMRLFEGCDDADLAVLESLVEARSFAPDDKLLHAGESDAALCLIRRGTVKVMVPIRKKESYHLATCGPGDIAGLQGFAEGRDHAGDVVALTETEVYVLTRPRFDSLSLSHPRLALAITGAVAAGLSARLRVTLGELQALRG